MARSSYAHETDPHLQLVVTAFYLIVTLCFLSFLYYCISSVHVSLYDVAFLTPVLHNFRFSVYCF